MAVYIVRRLLQALPVLVLSSIIVFMVIRLMPGDQAEIYLGPNATPEDLAAIRTEMGLRQPLPVQYLIWVKNVLRGDLGKSLHGGQPIAKLLLARAPATLQLTVAALLLSIVIAIPVGVLGATHTRGVLEWLISTVQSLLLAIPNFWAGILGVMVFAIILRWLPPGGRIADWNDPSGSLKTLLLPAVCLAFHFTISLSRVVKFNLLEVLYDDFVRTARAKGLGERSVIYGHALRNAMLPVITVIGLQFGSLMGGTVIIESVFSWPGIGTLMLDSIASRDYGVVQAGLLFLVVLFIAINLVVDLSYGVLDPRIRLGGG